MVKEHFEKAGLNKVSNCSQTLGFELLDLDIKGGTTKVKFHGDDKFLNPMGIVQGGILAAMLDDAMGMIGMLKLQGKSWVSTIDLNTQYLRPVRKGDVTVCAKIVSTGKNIMFAEGELYDSRNKLSARATCSLALTPIKTGEE